VIEVLYLNKPIAGSPFHCQVFDWAKINVSKLPHTTVTDRLVDFDSKILYRLGFVTYTNTRARARARAFNGPFSGTTRVGRYQKGKTNLDFSEARDSEWQWHQLGQALSDSFEFIGAI